MRFILSFFAIALSGFLCAQAPALIPYQAIARDASGQPLANATLNARFTIHDNTATGPTMWQEMQTVSTSALGLFTAQLGSNVSLGNVNWAVGAKFMQIEIDYGNGFVDIGTQQMLSVPYALFSADALNSQNSQNAQTAGNGISGVSLTGDTLFLANGNFVIVPGISDANGPLEILGCTSNTACNFNMDATEDDGSCYYIGSPCNDGNNNTFSDVYNASCICEGGNGIIGAAHSCGAPNVHNPDLTYGTMTDQEGNTYKTIVIGTQEWMAENLNTSIYRNGDLITTNLSNIAWQTASTGAWTFYNGDSSNECPYGKIYNFYAVIDERGLCPLGWHIPSDDEWTSLTTSLGGAGTALKSTGNIEMGTGLWYSPNTGATNNSGLSVLPSGFLMNNGEYIDLGFRGYLWGFQDISFLRGFYFDNIGVGRLFGDSPNDGASVRCLRD
jgi:uncharacterized protein (TIGR02145 family)